MELKEIMKTVAIVNLIVFCIVYGLSAFHGLEPKKKSSWFYGLYGFLSFFFVGFFFADLNIGLLVGVIMAFMVMFTGATIYWQRQWAKDAAKPWLLRYGQKDRLSLLARTIKNLRHK